MNLIEKNSNELKEKITILEDRVAYNEESISNLISTLKTVPRNTNNLECEGAVKRLEIESVKNNVILKCVNFHQSVKDSDNEDTFQTREVVIKILADMGAKNDIENLFEAQRFNRKSEENTKPPIKEKSWTTESKRIFRQLAKKKGTSKSENVKNLKVTDEIPKLLLKEYREAENKAYRFRQSFPGGRTRTRIDYKEPEINVQGKKPMAPLFFRL